MKKTKNIFVGAFALVLAFVLMFNVLPSTGLSGIARADVVTSTSAELSVSVKNNVEYGKSFAVSEVAGYTVTVTSPSGNTANVNAGSVNANELGNYTVKYTEDASQLSYSFNVYCSTENEYEIKVIGDADIPTVIAKGGSKVLPAAKVGFTDEDGKFVEDTTATVTVSSSESAASVNPGDTYTFANTGSVYLTYQASVAGGSKYVTKTYEVDVQDGFTDDKAPTLSVSGVPSSGNVGMKVTLPVATATDTYDKNVKVKITVKGLNAQGVYEDVKEVTVDDNDIAVSTLDDAVVFDNDSNMSFYPTTTGDYKVTYQAIDDSGNESAEWNYTVKVSDKKAPVMELDKSNCPTVWGMSAVTTLVGNDENNTSSIVGDALAIKIPVPEFYDNATAKDDVVLEFRIKDPESNTVIGFSNVNSTTSTTTCSMYDYDQNKAVTKTISFDRTNVEAGYFEFNFSAYAMALSVDDAKNDYNYLGSYTVTYVAKDTLGNRSTETYSIELKDTYDDTGVITNEFKNVPKYVTVDGETEFTVPAATATSSTDSALSVEYSIVSGGATLSVDKGETVTVKVESDNTVIENSNGETLTVDGGVITVKAVATSKSGNSLTAESSEIRVIAPSESVMFSDVYRELVSDINATVGELTGLGCFSVAVGNSDNVKYVGVELGVKHADENGVYVYDNTLEAQVYSVTKDLDSNPLQSKLVVRDINFTPVVAGEHIFEIRVFDINGNSKIYIEKFNVAENADSDIEVSSTVNVTSGSLNKVITLANSSVTIAKPMFGGESVFEGHETNIAMAYAHTVAGGRFALMGEELTACNTGFYTVTDQVVAIRSNDDRCWDNEDMLMPEKREVLNNALNATKKSSTVTIKNDATVMFELQGVMPTYAALNSTVTVPAATAFTEFGNATDIVVDIKDGNGNTVVKNGNESTWSHSFVASKNTEYTVTYTVKVAGKENETFSYTIMSGDVTSPAFNLVDANGELDTRTSYSVKSGATIKYLTISGIGVDSSNESKYTVTKTIYAPDGTVYTDSTSIDGSYSKYAATAGDEVELTSAGTYTVKYTMTNKNNGKTTVKEIDITVTKDSGSGVSLAMLSTILIIVGVLLIAAVVFYLFRFRRVDTKKKN